MEKIIIEQEGAGQRIDRFLVKEFFLYSRGEIIRKIKRGEVKLNGKNVKPSYNLEVGDEIEIDNLSREERIKELAPNTNLPLEVIFENQNIIVINKQAGIQVHPSSTNNSTLVNALIRQFPEIKDVHDDSEDAYLRPGIVHRLDKDTSGVMVVARNMESFNELKDAFKNRFIEKQYIAIVKGILKNKEGEIDKEIARSSDYRKQVIARQNTKTKIRTALTHYKVIGEFDGYSMLEVYPKTGRMHQIRIHLASIGHPIVGDLVYGDSKSEEITQKMVLRQMLHAKKLSFGLFGEKYEFEAKLPKDFEIFLANLEKL